MVHWPEGKFLKVMFLINYNVELSGNGMEGLLCYWIVFIFILSHKQLETQSINIGVQYCYVLNLNILLRSIKRYQILNIEPGTHYY